MAPVTVSIGYANPSAQGESLVQTTVTLTGDNFQGGQDVTPSLKSNLYSPQASINVLTANGTVITTTPNGAQGVLIQPPPPANGTAPLSVLSVALGNGTLFNICPWAPTDICFDANNVPANLSLNTNVANVAVKTFWY